MDKETKHELDLLWEHGIKVLRSDIRELSDNMTANRKWLIGSIVSAVPAYAGIIVALTTRK